MRGKLDAPIACRDWSLIGHKRISVVRTLANSVHRAVEDMSDFRKELASIRENVKGYQETGSVSRSILSACPIRKQYLDGDITSSSDEHTP